MLKKKAEELKIGFLFNKLPYSRRAHLKVGATLNEHSNKVIYTCILRILMILYYPDVYIHI